jgi:hypothetical protein
VLSVQEKFSKTIDLNINESVIDVFGFVDDFSSNQYSARHLVQVIDEILKAKDDKFDCVKIFFILNEKYFVLGEEDLTFYQNAIQNSTFHYKISQIFRITDIASIVSTFVPLSQIKISLKNFVL